MSESHQLNAQTSLWGVDGGADDLLELDDELPQLSSELLRER